MSVENIAEALEIHAHMATFKVGQTDQNTRLYYDMQWKHNIKKIKKTGLLGLLFITHKVHTATYRQ